MSKTLGLFASAAMTVALVAPALASPSPTESADQTGTMGCVSSAAPQSQTGIQHASWRTTGQQMAQSFVMPARHYDRPNVALGD